MFFVPYSGMDKVSIAVFSMSRLMLITFLAALMTVFGRMDTVQGALVIDIAVAKNVINKVYGNTLSKGLRSGDRLFQNQTIRTRRDSGIDIRFLDSSVLYIGELAVLTLDNMIYDVNEKAVTGALHIAKGCMRYASGSVANINVSVKTPQGTLGIRGTTFDVMASSGGTELAVHEGAVQVDMPSGSREVAAGQVYRISSTGKAGFERSASERMKHSVLNMLRLIEGSERHLSKSILNRNDPEETENFPFEQWPEEKTAIIGKNLDNLLYLDLAYGRVIIEMLPMLAPNHVKRIKELVRIKFYDGQIFHNVVAGFAAETGDPTGTGRGGGGTLCPRWLPARLVSYTHLTLPTILLV